MLVEFTNAKVWDAVLMNRKELSLTYVSPYGEEGFTGEVKVHVTYTWTDEDELVINYLAETNKKTIVNLTNHGFFSLAGIANPTPTIDNLICEINADYYLPIDETSIPTGEILKVADTPFDFRSPKPVGQDIDADDEQIKNGAGYDHCYVLNKNEEGEMSFAAKIIEPNSGRTMEVYTTEPGVQLYTHNWATGYPGQHGATFGRRSAICFECQHFPDTPNHPYFPSVQLCPDRKYKQKTIYKFGIDK
ncbi:aldose 1-epimerase [Prevotella sp. DNF00663]|nr:aldose 1-epimerase [Prevotella sp. DNF00663]